ncbi:hypothetical protein DMB66_19020 [Actinoplanes sp. ATCC 53533]|uniref:hypothetical protein n=1 Tax=Actinoplanes sp. ATCC 53533 TaxID=1288362 RepID=UPI000F772E8F|nr:hypothetical protein [Actinoplanes sp. ATCC 53533]RSM64737.1 hypothetical protein DMB66_19020 [Actinoplanes sp. ATCC 53533]
MTAVTTAGCGCGGGCGSGAGSAVAGSGAGLTRPLFFPGQLLTDEDLGALTGYVTAKARLHNRMILGAGVVCGLDVVCDPCGRGGVGVRAGYALDCCGHDIVVESDARLDVAALLRDLRHRSLGVDCGDPCTTPGLDPDDRDYGLYVRYLEERVEPVAAYPTGDSCGGDCQPSRVRETYGFLLKSIDHGDHGGDHGARLARCLGDPNRFEEIRGRAYRLDLFRPALAEVGAGPTRPVEFREEHILPLRTAYQDLKATLAAAGPTPSGEAARKIAEQVRRLAALIARYDLAAAEIGGVEEVLGEARSLFAAALGVLEPLLAKDQHVWDDPGLRATVRAVLTEAVARCGTRPEHGWEQERRMLLAGLPLTSEVRADLRRLREWLFVRLENIPDRGDCTLPADVSLPVPEPAAGAGPADARDLLALEKAAARLIGCLRRLLADCACRSLLPACHDCADSDVLLARLTLRDCAVLRICTIERPQVHTGGAWTPALHRAWELATRICCSPPADQPDPGEKGEDEPLELAYVEGLLAPPVYGSDLDELLALLREPARDELADLRERLAELERRAAP